MSYIFNEIRNYADQVKIWHSLVAEMTVKYQTAVINYAYG